METSDSEARQSPPLEPTQPLKPLPPAKTTSTNPSTLHFDGTQRGNSSGPTTPSHLPPNFSPGDDFAPASPTVFGATSPPTNISMGRNRSAKPTANPRWTSKGPKDQVDGVSDGPYDYSSDQALFCYSGHKTNSHRTPIYKPSSPPSASIPCCPPYAEDPSFDASYHTLGTDAVFPLLRRSFTSPAEVPHGCFLYGEHKEAHVFRRKEGRNLSLCPNECMQPFTRTHFPQGIRIGGTPARLVLPDSIYQKRLAWSHVYDGNEPTNNLNFGKCMRNVMADSGRSIAICLAGSLKGKLPNHVNAMDPSSSSLHHDSVSIIPQDRHLRG